MRHATQTLVVAFVVAVMMGIPCMAQDVEPPFVWKGEGDAAFISQYGTEEIDFEFELSVDQQGMFEGQTSNEDGVSKIKHLFYSEKKQYDYPGFFTRNIVVVLLLNEYGNDPMLSILNGRLLMDKFFYGEVMLARYEAGGDIAKALGVGDPVATLVEADELPYEVKSALKKCLPIGAVKIEGDYKEEATSAVAGDDATMLFNGRDLTGWHAYSKDPVDPQEVWTVQDGVLSCTGNPTGFLRTKEEYSDFKLVLEWRWPGKPGNSGVLLRMGSDEKIWPRCMEAQLMHTRAGDFVGMGYTFNENKSDKGGFISYTPRMNDSNEKQPGGWNTYEVVCKADTIEVTVNGQLQNKATGVNVRKGYIALQSEGVPIMFRNIKLTPLN